MTQKTFIETQNFQYQKIFQDLVINSPESKMRIGIQQIEEFVSKETKERKNNAPLSIEEKALFKN